MTRRGSAQKRASAAPSFHNNARLAEECQSILSKMIALLLALSCPSARFGGRRFGSSPYHGGYDQGGGGSFYRGYAYRAAPLDGGYDYGGQPYYGDNTYSSGTYDDSTYAGNGSNYTDDSARGRRRRRGARQR